MRICVFHENATYLQPAGHLAALPLDRADVCRGEVDKPLTGAGAGAISSTRQLGGGDLARRAAHVLGQGAPALLAFLGFLALSLSLSVSLT